MLVLSRRLNEKIVIPCIRTAIQVIGIRPGTIRLGIDGPPEVKVFREELRDQIGSQSEVTIRPAPASSIPDEWERLLGRRLDLMSQGLSIARRQMQGGLYHEAEGTFDGIEEDLKMLRRRLGNDQRPQVITPPKTRKALLVEDNPNERELLATFLRRCGLEVDTAGDGADALDYLRRSSVPDVMLLDMGLPRCDGPTTVRAVRQNPNCAGLRIFAVTGHLPGEYDLPSGPAGIDRWFHKPIDPAALVRDLNLVLNPPRDA
jgi:two-component system, OmpR family, response regulator